MSYSNTPLKTLQAEITNVVSVSAMAWYNPVDFPVLPGHSYPLPVYKDYKWRVTLTVETQNQSSYITRAPGRYTGVDIVVGMWIANAITGQSWQIITVDSKTDTTVVAVVQDIYRYNTFKDPSMTGNGSPNIGPYIAFNLSEAGTPIIDPVPTNGVSADFAVNLQSRFSHSSGQNDYPLYQADNNFVINDVIAVDNVTHSFVKSSSDHRVVIGRVTSISDTIPGWFTISPVRKIVDYLDYLPGNVGDSIYIDLNNPGQITLDPRGTELYLKLRNNTSTISRNTIFDAVTTVGNVFQINGINVGVTNSGNLSDVEYNTNLVSTQTGVSATTVLAVNTIYTNDNLVNTTYNEPILYAASHPAIATINGVTVTFNVLSPEAGYTNYSKISDMVTAINRANIPNIVASVDSIRTIKLDNTSGGAINIVNISTDLNGVNFAGTNSGSGLVLNKTASTAYQIEFRAIDARAINFLDIVGTTILDLGLVSVENGVKACGLYIEAGLRTSTSTVVTNLTQMYSLLPMVGDTAFVINSDDGFGNNVNQWSQWLYNGSVWTKTGSEDSANVDAKSLEYTLEYNSAGSGIIGEISSGRRVTLITVEVLVAFNKVSTLSIGYQINTNPITTGTLMVSGLVDMTKVGVYTTTSSMVFGTDTTQGDISVNFAYLANTATAGRARIIVTYV